MATSLTNNVLTFDHGSIPDVINDRSIMVPLSLKRSATLSPRLTPSSITLSAGIGEAVTDFVYCKNSAISITSNEGTWIFQSVPGSQNSLPMDRELIVFDYPMFKNGDNFGIGTLNIRANGQFQYTWIMFFAMRVA